MSEPTWVRATECENIPLREGRAIQVGDREIAVFNLGDRFLAVENRCPHRSGPLADGIVSGTNIVCPLHAWKFSLETGRGAGGPAGPRAGHSGRRSYRGRSRQGSRLWQGDRARLARQAHPCDLHPVQDARGQCEHRGGPVELLPMAQRTRDTARRDPRRYGPRGPRLHLVLGAEVLVAEVFEPLLKPADVHALAAHLDRLRAPAPPSTW